jgi:ubiquinone/menaquinone biosynthesis C-methylase UbiE
MEKKNFYQNPEVAKDYDQDRLNTNFRRYKHYYETKLLLVSLEPKENIIEVGSGTGRLTKELLERGFRITPTDYSAAMLEIFKKNIPGVQPQIADITNLPFADNSFDATFSLRVIWHLMSEEKQQLALRELARVTKNKIIIDITNDRHINNKLLSFLRGIYFWLKPNTFSLANEETFAMNLDKFILWSKTAGWEVKKIYPLDVLPQLWLNFIPSSLAKLFFPAFYALDRLASYIYPPQRYLICLSKKKI